MSTKDRVPKSWLTVALLLIGVASFGQTALAQVGEDVAYPKNLTEWQWFESAASRRQTTFSRMPGLSREYHLGVGDQLEVTVVSQPLHKVRVDADGTVNIPLAGYVAVAGLTAEETEQAIANALRRKDLVHDPQVLVFISKYEAKRVYSIGEVDRPGEYAVSFDMTLMDLIFLSGGIDFTAGRYGYLHRRGDVGSAQWKPAFVKADLNDLMRQPDTPRAGGEVIRVDLQPMKEGRVLEKNIMLKTGDVLYVPRRKIELVYVIGDVPNAGAFNMPEDVRLTAAQAIAWAGGPRKTARLKDGLLVRQEPGGERVELPVDFAAILDGRQTDVTVLPDDIIFVPGSGSKTLGIGLLNTIPTVLSRLLLF